MYKSYALYINTIYDCFLSLRDEETNKGQVTPQGPLVVLLLNYYIIIVFLYYYWIIILLLYYYLRTQHRPTAYSLATISRKAMSLGLASNLLS